MGTEVQILVEMTFLGYSVNREYAYICSLGRSESVVVNISSCVKFVTMHAKYEFCTFILSHSYFRGNVEEKNRTIRMFNPIHTHSHYIDCALEQFIHVEVSLTKAIFPFLMQFKVEYLKLPSESYSHIHIHAHDEGKKHLCSAFKAKKNSFFLRSFKT